MLGARPHREEDRPLPIWGLLSFILLRVVPATGDLALLLPYAALESRLAAYVATRPGEYGIYFEDLETGTSISLAARESFFAASTVKVPVVLYLMEKVLAGQESLTNSEIYLPGDYKWGSGVIQYQPTGSRYTLLTLAQYCFRYSDNVAVNMLRRRFGPADIGAYQKSLGASVVLGESNVTSPYSTALYLRRWLEIADTDPRARELFAILESSKPLDRIPAGLPPGIRCAHKIGNWHGVINDVAVVYAQHPYILCLYSRGVTYGQGTTSLAGLSALVYQYQAEHWAAERERLEQQRLFSGIEAFLRTVERCLGRGPGG